MSANAPEEKLLALVAELKASYQPSELAQLARLISPAPSTGDMSANAFERVIQVLVAQNNRRPYSEKSKVAARLVLVMGASIAEAAAEVGLSRQVVNRLMLRIRSCMESLPAGWVKVSDWFPGDVAKQLGALSEPLRALHATGKPVDALNVSITLTKPTD